MNNFKLICPDCAENEISTQRMKDYGKCISCFRRETISKSLGRDYIPYKDLPEKEKERIRNQRNLNNTKKVEAVKTIGTKLPEKELVKKFLDKFEYCSKSFVAFKSTELYKQFTIYCSTHYYSTISKIDFYRIILNDFGFKKRQSNGDNYYYFGSFEGNSFVGAIRNQNSQNMLEDKNIKEQLPSDKTPPGSRKGAIYTTEVIEYIKDIAATGHLTITDILNAINEKYPNKPFSKVNLSNIIARHQIPHYRIRKSKDTTMVEVDESKKPDVDKFVEIKKDEVVNLEIDSNKFEDVEEYNLDLKNSLGDSSLNSGSLEDRLTPIKEEVLKVLNTKFVAMKCQTSYNVRVEDYLHILEFMEYLCNNIEDLIQIRNNQYDIANCYQDDIIHEMENTLAENGNTYLQDKMHVFRDIRRFIESDRDALKLIKPLVIKFKTFFNGVANKKIISQLSSLSNNIENPKFIPTVDLGMVNKYSWATYGSTKSAKNNKQIFVTNELEKTIEAKQEDFRTVELKNGLASKPSSEKLSTIVLTKEEVDKGVGVYRVTCELSGGGYGAFSKWYKDYVCFSSDIAEGFAKQELARIKSANKSVLITNLQVNRLNAV